MREFLIAAALVISLAGLTFVILETLDPEPLPVSLQLGGYATETLRECDRGERPMADCYPLLHGDRAK